MGYLVQHGTNAEVPKVADRLLDRLLTAFPALQVGWGLLWGARGRWAGGCGSRVSRMTACGDAAAHASHGAAKTGTTHITSPQFKPEVLAAMFQAADEEEQAAKLVRGVCMFGRLDAIGYTLLLSCCC